MLFRRIMVAVGAAALVATPGAAQAAPGQVSADQGSFAAAPSASDAAFLRAANEVNLAGIAHGRIAFTKTRNAEVKEIAGRFMVDHIRLNAEITEAARKLKVRLDFVPAADQRALSDRYEAASASAFDALYLSTQLELQREAKRIADAQAAGGDDADLKRVAADSAPILAEHQKMLREATN